MKPRSLLIAAVALLISVKLGAQVRGDIYTYTTDFGIDPNDIGEISWPTMHVSLDDITMHLETWADVPQFNPAMGTLNGVDLSVQSGGFLTMTCTGGDSGFVWIGGNGTLQVDGALGETLYDSNHIPGTGGIVFAPDGEGDYAVPVISAGASYPAYGMFVGTGSWPVWAIGDGTADLYSYTHFNGTVFGTFDFGATIHVEVDYDYTPLNEEMLAPSLAVAESVPEPASLLILGLGVFGTARPSNRRRASSVREA